MKKTLLLTFVVLTSLISAAAQSTAALRGRVTDERGAAIAGAEAHLRSRSGAHLLLVIDRNGDYSFKYVVPGDYVLEIIAPGFATSTSKGLSFRWVHVIIYDMRLSILAISDNI